MRKIYSSLTLTQRVMALRILIGMLLFTVAMALGLAIPEISPVAELLCYLLSYLIVSYDVILDAFRKLFSGTVFSENLLMVIATFGAFALGDYNEGCAVMLFFQVGELFQDFAVASSRRSIASLMDIRPDTAAVVRGGVEIIIDPSEAELGEEILIHPGERIPLDSIVLSGTSSVDTSALTGESVPRDVEPGSELISGCININGLLHAKVTKTSDESTVSRILEMVENASSQKARAERFIAKFARWYTPLVVGSALLLALLPPLLNGGEWSVWIERALIFLVISCPCALVISIPLSFFGAIGGAARRGILIKGSNYLEALADTSIVVFDKTGTLTEGQFNVISIHTQNIEESRLLELAAAAESSSRHPIAQSILRAYGKPVDKSLIKDITEYPGEGVEAIYGEYSVCAGNTRIMERCGASYDETADDTTVVHIAVGGKYAGYIEIADKVKPNAKPTLERLGELGIKETIMLTGDRTKVGEKVALELNIGRAYCELMPDNKVSLVEELLRKMSNRTTLAYVGDGVNDAPVLTRADVGIAMGALGSDAAIEAADIVLMDDDPLKLCDAVTIARRTRVIVRQNIVIALGIKIGFLLFAAIGIANMWAAVFADVGVAIIAILNALRAMENKK